MSRDLPVGLGLASAPFARRLAREAGIATAAIGFIPGPKQADDIVQKGQLDVVLLAPGAGPFDACGLPCTSLAAHQSLASPELF
jgi:hypothetical protein